MTIDHKDERNAINVALRMVIDDWAADDSDPITLAHRLTLASAVAMRKIRALQKEHQTA